MDAKSRLALPTRFRETMQIAGEGRLVVTIDMDEHCLLMYPLPEWEVVQRDLEALSNIHPDARRLQRLMIGHATDLDLDANGRIVIPPMLRDFAQLEKPVVLVGQGNKIEIWSESNWRDGMSQWLPEKGARSSQDLDALTGLSV
jgi:MraZ protein